MKLYTTEQVLLQELIADAQGPNSKLLLPELQRPFVWTPNQIVLLIDSLLRGWPLGTFLLWHIKDHMRIPPRPFWTVVDRTVDPNPSQAQRMQPPAEYQLVLDGQQRLQSLVLAFGADQNGIRMYDRDWRNGRGRATTWSKRSLCLDLHRLAEFQPVGIPKADFRDLLVWAILDPQDVSDPSHRYQEDPNPAAWEDNGALQPSGRYIRLSRLWEIARGNITLPEEVESAAKDLLIQYRANCSRNLDRLLSCFIVHLSQAKNVEVMAVKLRSQQDSKLTESEYAEAIVNTFTRLNSAGTVLTRQDISFAWLSTGWDHHAAGGSARHCYETFLDQIRQKCPGVSIDSETLTAILESLWNVTNSANAILNEELLLRGQAAQMARDVSQHWSKSAEFLLEGLSHIAGRSLISAQHNHIRSNHALAVYLCWYYLIRRHADELNCAVPDMHRITQILDKYTDRWFFVSQWSGEWRRAGSRTIQAYVNSLRDLRDRMPGELEGAVAAWRQWMEGKLAAMQVRSKAHVMEVCAERSSDTASYFQYLWLWHRLDERRWECSDKSLRIAGRANETLEVDHIIPRAWWHNHCGSLPADYKDLVHSIGNCMLIAKNFNISRGKNVLAEYLSRINGLDADAWRSAMQISVLLAAPDASRCEALCGEIRRRAEAIQNELIEFLDGTRLRQDL